MAAADSGALQQQQQQQQQQEGQTQQLQDSPSVAAAGSAEGAAAAAARGGRAMGKSRSQNASQALREQGRVGEGTLDPHVSTISDRAAAAGAGRGAGGVPCRLGLCGDGKGAQKTDIAERRGGLATRGGH